MYSCGGKSVWIKIQQGFFAGYSPERINPGDKLHTVEKIKKVTSGSTLEVGRKIDEIYASVIVAGTSGSYNKSGRGCKSNRELSARYKYRFRERVVKNF